MGYVAGETILDDEYNGFATNTGPTNFGINHIAGTGSAEYGLGQTPISTVNVGDTVSAAQWNSLFTVMSNIANHTNDTLTSTGAVTSGDNIAIRSALQADLNTLAASVAAGCPNTTATSTNAVGSSSFSGTWNTSGTIERSVTFADADTMRHYFNAGGKIRAVVGVTTGIDGLKDTVFNDLATALGNLDIASQASTRSGSGETLTTDGLSNGFHDLGTGYTTIIKLTSDNSGYTSNTLEISAKLDAAVGTAVTMTIKMVAVDADNDDTYTAGNTDGVPTNPNEAPVMSLSLTEVYPNNTEGLAAAIQTSSNAEVSNSAS